MADGEQRLMEARIELLELEVARQKTPKARDGIWSSPAILAIAGATATAIVGFSTNQFQLSATRQLERDKLESSLILKAIDSDNANTRLEALQFLVKAGLIHDVEKRTSIGALQPADVPQIQYRPESVAAPSSGAVSDLVAKMNDEVKETRLAAVDQLIKTAPSDPAAIDRAISMLEPPTLETLSPQGRINVMVFLHRTDRQAWTEESVRRTRAAIANIRSRASQGVAIGDQTKTQLAKLEAFLSTAPNK